MLKSVQPFGDWISSSKDLPDGVSTKPSPFTSLKPAFASSFLEPSTS
ncbi:Uncharacterised protein [Vibrio cholerae]|nr:Uncharacterised protein [Vibrio cholerae]